jgi:hypothetical protein
VKRYSEYLAARAPLQLAVGGRVLYVQRSQAGQLLDIQFLQGVARQSVPGSAKVSKGRRPAVLTACDSQRQHPA